MACQVRLLPFLGTATRGTAVLTSHASSWPLEVPVCLARPHTETPKIPIGIGLRLGTSGQRSLVDTVSLVGRDAHHLQLSHHACVSLLNLYQVGKIVLRVMDQDAV
jgi:hypothetical protein